MMSRLKPMQLLWFIGVSNFVAATVVVVLAALSWHLQEDQHLPHWFRVFSTTALFFMAAALAGECLLWWGIRSGDWTNSALARPRRYVAHPAVLVAFVTMVLLSIVYFIVAPPRHSFLGVLLLNISTNLLRTKTYLTPKDTRTGFLRITP